MYLKLIRNKANGSAITGRLVIDGRWFCNTLERKGYEILALCYRVAVTMSPRFKRLLPIVQNVPQRSGIRFHRGTKPEHSTGCILVLGDNELKTTQTTISQTNTICDKENDSLARCDVGTAQMLSKLSSKSTKPEHSTGCVLVLADNELKTTQTTISQTNTICDKENDSLARCDVGTAQMLSKLSSKSTKPVVVGRSAAEVEQELTQLLLQTQNNHEEIILEVIDYRPGTEYGYDHPCESVLQEHNRDAHRAEERYYQLHPEERAD